MVVVSILPVSLFLVVFGPYSSSAQVLISVDALKN